MPREPHVWGELRQPDDQDDQRTGVVEIGLIITDYQVARQAAYGQFRRDHV